MRTLAWPLEPDEIEAVFRAMRFAHCKWDIYHRGQHNLMPDAIVLSRSEHELLTETAGRVWTSLRQLEKQVIESPEALAGVGIPEILRPAIADTKPSAPRLSRCDFHLTVGGRWMISEFNEDGPGGFSEAHGLNAVLSEQWGQRFDALEFPVSIRDHLVAAFEPWPRIGLVYATAYSEDLQQITLIADWLRAAGHQAVCGSPANLVMDEDSASLFGEPVDALFRYFPGEWLGDLPNAGDWLQAIASVPMINSLSALVAQSKRFYAAANEHDLDMADDEREIIATHLPESRYLEPGLREQLIREREDWVLKGAFGRMGDTVRLGIGCSPQQWADTLDRALGQAGLYAVQQRFDTVPMWFSSGLAYATVGMYLLDGHFAGYYSRVSPYPVINYDSCHVATLVETA
jgi:glutathionylspermidine synthase